MGVRTSPAAPAFEDSPPDPAKFQHVDCAIVLPTLNEERGLPATVRGIPLEKYGQAGRRMQILVVDGGSADATLSEADALGLPVLRQKTRGKGNAIREAFAWLRGAGVRYAAVMDADSTYPGEMVGALHTLLSAGSHIVVGVRMPMRIAPLGVREIVHRIGNATLNFAAGRVTGRRILDLCSGFWALDLATRLDEGLESAGFEIEAELFLKAYRQGYHVVQFPIPYRPRIGQAKLRAARDGYTIMARILRSTRFPLPIRAVDPPRHSPFLRQLLSICVVRGSDNLLVIADNSRREEAEALIAELNRSEVNARIHYARGHGDPGSGEWSEILTFVGETGNPVLHLGPSANELGGGEPSYHLFLPSLDRVYLVRLGTTGRESEATRSEGVSRNAHTDPHAGLAGSDLLGPVWGALGGSVTEQDLQFLTANGLRAAVLPRTASTDPERPAPAPKPKTE